MLGFIRVSGWRRRGGGTHADAVHSSPQVHIHENTYYKGIKIGDPIGM